MPLQRLILLVSGGLILAACAADAGRPPSERSASPHPQPGSDLLLEAAGIKPTNKALSEPKIVGGQKAVQGDDPWQVALIANGTQTRSAFCGGSLIKRDWVLTAAHCADQGTRPDQVDILYGSVDLNQAHRVHVRRIIVHPGWNPSTHDNDLALLQLSSATDYLGVGLITKAEETAGGAPGVMTRVTGWGSTAMRGDTIRLLQTVAVPIVDHDDCNDVVSYDGQVSNNMVCAGRQNGGADSCQGDSGGPLTVALNGRRVLIGVVSWGRGCALPNKYGVYARVANYGDWVAREVR